MEPTPLGVLYSWQRGDPLPALPPLAGFRATATQDKALLAELACLPRAEVRARLSAGNQPYLAWLDKEPVAYGWSATTRLEIGELRLTRPLPPDAHYLWDFATLEAWRGRGIYPRLLQAILRAEASATERFWIGHEPDNVASSRGIRAAGFLPAGELFGKPDGSTAMRLAPGGDPARLQLAAELIGVPVWPGDVG